MIGKSYPGGMSVKQQIPNMRLGKPKRVFDKAQRVELDKALSALSLARNATSETSAQYHLSEAYRLIRRNIKP